MVGNPYAKYQENSINTASGPELTLMLYNGAIKFCNIAVEAINNKNVAKAHENIIKVENIIMELRATLNKKYPIALEMDQIYEYIYEILVQGNIKKDPEKVEEACKLIRTYRDAWQIAMKSRR
ncbi:flagellar export chaperone FliS [Cellulosilyticum ruminicola]|uniref:flagellar export chaperone FliS n=1 Tax=Cellulosilyticum ruminicola TaxID=425254 RepID=UPI0006CF8C8F|nr:flagellar export chaperone FliS [Cellulosilyticum ruminicola]